MIGGVGRSALLEVKRGVGWSGLWGGLEWGVVLICSATYNSFGNDVEFLIKMKIHCNCKFVVLIESKEGNNFHRAESFPGDWG